MRFGGDCGRRFGALTVAAFFGFDFGGAGGWAIAGFGLGVFFFGRISPFGFGASGTGLTKGFGADGFARGGGGGGGGGFFAKTLGTLRRRFGGSERKSAR
jgi:hypothetical protein